jgi:shikimate dehydrogenase
VIARPSRLVLLGHPVHHSLSPLFQNAALRSAGIPLVYQALDVSAEDLVWVLAELAAAGAAGNVTIPHKEAVAALCERRTPLAERVGAVNTFLIDARGALSGDNTDVGGFERLVRDTVGELPQGKRIAVLGAGGAAAAVLAAVEAWPGCEVTLCNRSAPRAARLAARFAVVARVTSSPIDAVRGAAVVVNATAVGLEGDCCPVPIDALAPDAAAIDLVYRRGQTPWVRAALARGLRASDGLPMLVEQGALAFERWFGLEAPRKAMWDAVRDA